MEINTLFQEALLAQAAYADLTSKLSREQLIIALKKKDGITQAQAEYFVERYKVIHQSESSVPDTGFSATLFQDKDTGEYHLAIRGSASFSFTEPDWIDANVNNLFNGIAFNQVADLLNFYLRLTHTLNEPVTQFAFVQAQNEPSLPVWKTA